MSAISGASTAQQTNMLKPPVQQKQATPATTNVRDADGDFDGTRVGSSDPRDAGKGMKIDIRA